MKRNATIDDMHDLRFEECEEKKEVPQASSLWAAPNSAL